MAPWNALINIHVLYKGCLYGHFIGEKLIISYEIYFYDYQSHITIFFVIICLSVFTWIR